MSSPSRSKNNATDTLPSGVLLVNKPRGMTSHDVVDRIRRVTGIRRVGHAGTLDPLAEGLLIILIGEATKRQAEFMAGEKEYLATIRLGATSDTDDAEGRIMETPNTKAQIPNEAQIRERLKQFVGKIEQVPPAYSAIKIRGRKAYELARKGERPELKPRRITISEIETLDYLWPTLKLRVICSPGTYIRALARDLGNEFGTGAYLQELTRTRSSIFSLMDALSLDGLMPQNWKQSLINVYDEKSKIRK